MVGSQNILWVTSVSAVPEFVISVGALLLAIILSLVFLYIFERKLSNIYSSDRPIFIQLIKSIQIFLAVMVFLWGAFLFDVPILSQLFSLGVASTTVGLLITAVGSAVISGLLLVQSNAYEAGDVIEIPDRGVRGIVEEVTLVNTRLRLPDDSYLVIPNRSIRNRDIINRTLGEDTIHRTSVDILITYESDLPEALEIIQEAAECVDEIKQGSCMDVGQWTVKTDPTTQIVEFGDNGIKLRLMYWIEEPCNIGAVRTDLFKSIYVALEDTGIEFAYPHNHLHFDETSGDIPVNLTNRDC